MKKIIIIFLVVFLLNIGNIFNAFGSENTKIYELNMKLAKEKILKKENGQFYIKSIDAKLEKFSKEEFENILQKIPLYLEKNREKNRDFVIYIKNKSVILLKTGKNISENKENDISKKEGKIVKNTVIGYEFDLGNFEVEKFDKENFTLKSKNDEEVKIRFDFDLITKEDFEKEGVKNFEELKEKFASMIEEGMEIKSKNFGKINGLLIKEKERGLMLLAYNEKKGVSLNMYFEGKNYSKYEKDFENLVSSFEFDNEDLKIGKRTVNSFFDCSNEKKCETWEKLTTTGYVNFLGSRIYLEKDILKKITGYSETKNISFGKGKIEVGVFYGDIKQNFEYKNLIPEDFEINGKKYKKYERGKYTFYFLESDLLTGFVSYNGNEKFPDYLEQALKSFEFTTFIKK